MNVTYFCLVGVYSAKRAEYMCLTTDITTPLVHAHKQASDYHMRPNRSTLLVFSPPETRRNVSGKLAETGF
jgi:hypothetical protein